MDQGSSYWSTAVSDVERNDIRIRGYPLDDLMAEATFPEVVHLTLQGELPNADELEVLNTALNTIIDHFFISAAIPATRHVASGNPNVAAAVSGGILSMGSGAGSPEATAEMILEVVNGAEEEGSLEAAASKVVKSRLMTGEAVPGIGHPTHDVDPRTSALREVSNTTGVAGEFVAGLEQIAAAFADEKGLELPINADGMMAAVLLEIGYSPQEIAGVAAISFLPGIIAHAVEEFDAKAGLRYEPDEITEYTGEPPRVLARDPEVNRR